MKKLLLLLLGPLCLAACRNTATEITLPDGFTVRAALAVTPEEHTQGLMFVKHLPEDKGMLFVFDHEQPQAFWMKNTFIDLDIVFIDARHQVTSVEANVPRSFTYTPDREVAIVQGEGMYVLELPAKTAAKHGIRAGSELSFSL